MNCTNCGTECTLDGQNCLVCGAFIGFPNVRLAESPEEQEALAIRVNDAKVSARARTCEPVLESFGIAMTKSKVVIARSLNVLSNLVNSENVLYVNFHQAVASGARIPESNQWDTGRVAAESTVSPFFFKELNFGALTLNGKGLSSYGPYSIVLKDKAIELRTTVFEENPFIFCKRHKISAGQPAPLGFRATWAQRDLLAKAKLHSKLSSSTKEADFSSVIMTEDIDPERTDFLEAHIYGVIHRNAIERVIGPKPIKGAARVIWKDVKEQLTKLGAELETI
jgi:hypothetical protein